MVRKYNFIILNHISHITLKACLILDNKTLMSLFTLTLVYEWKQHCVHVHLVAFVLVAYCSVYLRLFDYLAVSCNTKIMNEFIRLFIINRIMMSRVPKTIGDPCKGQCNPEKVGVTGGLGSRKQAGFAWVFFSLCRCRFTFQD